VNAALAARLPFEVLHRVGHKDPLAIDPHGLQRLVQDAPRRSYERMAGLVLLITGLLADQHQRRLDRSFSEYGLGGVLPQTAGPARQGFPGKELDAARHRISVYPRWRTLIA
jgi:hypothetical protein